jgi:hypothetical protein
MNMKSTIATVCVLVGFSINAHGAEKPDLPNVLIIGGSISIGYTRPLKEILKGKANVFHNPGNAAHSENGIAKLDSWLGTTKWDVIHFNHGLHDLKYIGKNVHFTSQGSKALAQEVAEYILKEIGQP